MKRYIFIFLLICSCSSISDKITIDKKDYNPISKEVEHNYLYAELEKTDFYYDKEFFKLLNSMQYEIDDVIVSDFAETLPNLIIKRLHVSNEKIREIYKLENVNPLVYNYLSLFEIKREDYSNAYNNAWISKSASPTYLADEIFMYMYFLANEKEKVEEVLVDMEDKFRDYPLNKYNRIFYRHLYDFDEIKEEDFGKARIEIRKINNSFYPELQGYKVNYLMMIDLLQANYYFVKKDSKNLSKIKDEINKTSIKYSLDLRKINEFIDERIEYLKKEV
ncbi:hypothetical protein [Streptobacillus notomytis]|uniref:hypothetical protein n=1 Tax=Streptobacillus notomytis TaxID=1712031 RepID=UPI00082E28B3|nr:hypothetical protein [Streptobacillus notomytis]